MKHIVKTAMFVSTVTAVVLTYQNCSGAVGQATQMSSSGNDLSSDHPDAPTPVPPQTTSGPIYYFSNCGSGAAPTCVPGDNANDGTSAARPKRDLSGFNFNTLPAGTQLLFARGGAWGFTGFIRLENNNVTTAQPLVIDAYGSGDAPLFVAIGLVGPLFEFGSLGNVNNDGGYSIRNLRLDGTGTSAWGFWLRDNVHHVTLESLQITGFQIGIHSQSAAPTGVRNFVLRNSQIYRNGSMGILGQFIDSVIENNLFLNNNFSGSGFNHAIYLSGNANGGTNITIRGNVFDRNSVVDGVCTGGNVTFHGVMDGVLIENNTIRQDAATGGCYGFSITAGYNTAESFTNFVVRGNTVVNLGNCSVCANSAPGIVVENNTFVNSQTNYHSGVSIGGPPDPGDAPDRDAIVRDNIACFPNTAPNQSVVALNNVPNSQLSNNTLYQGAAAAIPACDPD